MAAWGRFLAAQETRFAFCVFVIYLLPVLTYTMPGIPPENASSDRLLALGKAAILGSVIFGGTVLVLHCILDARFRQAARAFVFLIAFFAWAVTTILWSPLKGTSVGQVGGFYGLLVYAIVLASIADHRGNVSRILWHLCASLVCLATLIVGVYFVDPVASGLDRSILNLLGDGLVHPTASGAAASLSLLLASIACFVFRFHWAKGMLIATLITSGPLLLLSNSRTATILAALTIPACVWMFGTLRFRAVSVLMAGAFCLAYLVLDPGFALTEDALGSSAQYLMRGQDVSQLRQASGRQEMWSAVWSEYVHAPVCGHGYYMTSRTGSLYVWNHFANHTAHNVYLQVLAGTGLIGLSLLLVGLGVIAFRSLRLFGADRFANHLGWSLVFCAAWYLGWSLGCSSFMGPLRYESVVFFTLVGIAVGQTNRIMRRPDEISS